MNDYAVLVNSDDVVIGQLDKYQTHRHPAQLHRAISVWMFDDRGRVLMQKRSQQKIVGAGWWGNTVCGNNWPEETYEQCAQRRLQHELGITGAELTPLVKFHYQTYANEMYGEHEMDQVFVSRVSSETLSIVPNVEEVSEVQWIDAKNFFQEMEEKFLKYHGRYDRTYPSAHETVGMTTQELKESTIPLPCSLLGKGDGDKSSEELVVPWTLVMLQLPEVRALFA